MKTALTPPCMTGVYFVLRSTHNAWRLLSRSLASPRGMRDWFCCWKTQNGHSEAIQWHAHVSFGARCSRCCQWDTRVNAIRDDATRFTRFIQSISSEESLFLDYPIKDPYGWIITSSSSVKITARDYAMIANSEEIEHCVFSFRVINDTRVGSWLMKRRFRNHVWCNGKLFFCSR